MDRRSQHRKAIKKEEESAMHVLSGVLMGLLYVASPGPVSMATMRVGLADGLPAALGLQCGAMFGRVFYAILGLTGIGMLLAHTVLHPLLGFAGAEFICYLGWCSLRDGLRGARAAARASRGAVGLPGRAHHSVRRALSAGAALSLTNPVALAFWLSAGATMLPPGSGHAALFLAGFWGGVLLWALGFSLLVSGSISLLGAHRLPTLSGISGLVLIAMGVSLAGGLA